MYTNRNHEYDNYDNFDASATYSQIEVMRRNKIPFDHRTTRSQAAAKIERYILNRRRLQPTEPQKYVLKQHGRWRNGMTRGEAWDTIAEIKESEQTPRYERPDQID